MNFIKTFFPKKEEFKKVISLPVNSIVPNPNQPRHNFSEDSLSDLADSIKQYGLISPIVVRQTGNIYELIAGERRLRATKMAGYTQIEAIIENISSNNSALIALVENLQRENLDFIEEALAYEKLLKEYGFTQEQLAYKIGKSQSSVANKVRILRLSHRVREIISRHSLTERHARAILRIVDEKTQMEVLDKIITNGLNVKKTDEYVDKILEKADGKFDEKPKRPFYTHNFSNVKVVVNTVRQAVDFAKMAGFEASFNQKDDGEFMEYVVRIHK